jgi:hypothetical protein
MRKKKVKSKPMTCVACDFNKAAIQDAQAQFQQADSALRAEVLQTACLREELALWKRIWTEDSRHWAKQAITQADLLAALVEGNKALRAALDKHELFHVKSRELRA